MKLLVDTVAFLWIVADDRQLSCAARAALEDPENDVYLSAASVWEICIKHRLGKIRLPITPERLVPEQRNQRGIAALPIGESSTLRLSQLPDVHRDTFDRILICQAIEHAMTLVTPDQVVRNYPIRSIW